MEILAEYGYIGLFLAAFIAATILPLGSEVVLSLLLINGLSPVLLVLVATLGNVLGSLTNYYLGYGGGVILRRKVETVSKRELDGSLARLKKYGVYSLLFSWLPVIGDPLTVAAGVLRIKLSVFLLLVTVGKLGRYIVLTFIILSYSKAL